MQLSTLLLLGFAIIGNAAANILIKLGALHMGKTNGVVDYALKALTNPAIIGGIVLFAIVLGAYSAVLAKVPLSIAYPLMTSLGFVIVVLTSVILFKETLRFPQVIGIVLILIGLWLVARYLRS